MNTNTSNDRGDPFRFIERDVQMFEQSYLTLELVLAQGWYRAADSINGADVISHKPTALKDYNGYVIEYYHPITKLLRESVLRLDNPESDGGKYRGPYGRTNMFYVPLGVLVEWLKDRSIDVVFVEGEKKALALWRIALENAVDGVPAFIPIGLRGVWGWMGATGNKDLPGGGHERAKGPLNDFDFLDWCGRVVYILFDSNLHSPKPKTSESIRAARRGLSHHLHYTLQAKVFFGEMTLEHFENGINGPDDLAGSPEYGPAAVLQLLDEAIPAVKPTRIEREKPSPEDREAQARALREAAGKSTDALASDVLGGGAARHLLKLWRQAGFVDDEIILLIGWEALAQGCDELDYYYVELYELLYNCDGSHLEQTDTGAHTLKNSCRKTLSDRIARLETKMEQIGIRFADPTPGYLDVNDNTVQSHVTLYSRQYVAECLVLAESLPGYQRGKKAARESAIMKFITEKSGVAYVPKLPPRPNRSKQIADGWKRVQGNMRATIERMADRKDPEEVICKTAVEAINEVDPRIIDYIERRARAKFEAEQRAHAETGFGVTSEECLTDAESTDDFARFEKTCTNPQDKERSLEIWDRLRARHQVGKSVPTDLMDATDEMTAAILAEGEKGVAL